jgi:tRNA nucleotidyltransferase (CCA-adding enzyme)
MRERSVLDLMNERMPRETVELLRALGSVADRRRTAAYVVGGVVRDLLLEIPDEDLDIVVDERADAFAAGAAEELGGDVKAHTRFGTAVLVLPGGRKIDVATSRSESYERPGALPTVAAGGIRDDLRRRDFTVNAMAIRINRRGFGGLVDFFGGARDLERGTLRVLTERSFEDDPTRILRGVRFAARYGFHLEPRTEKLLRSAVGGGGLATISGERILNELVLILRERRPWPPVARLIEWEILPAVHEAWRLEPGLGAAFDALGRLLEASPGREVVPEGEAWRVLLLAMLEPLAPDARTAILERLRAAGRVADLASDLARFEDSVGPALESPGDLSRSAIHRTAATVAPEVLILALATRDGTRATSRIALYLSELRTVETSLAGDDITALGVPEGPAVGEILQALLAARLDGKVATEEDERALATRLALELDSRNKNC